MSAIVAQTVYKVVNTVAPGKAGRRGSSALRSALLNKSKAMIDYQSATGRNYIQPTVDGTPFVCFDNVQAAFDFITNRPHRVVYAAHIYGTVVPITKVLKLQPRWDTNIGAFWAAVFSGADLTEFSTRSAPDGSIAVFGVLRLTQPIAYRPPVNDVPAAPLGDALGSALGTVDPAPVAVHDTLVDED